MALTPKKAAAVALVRDGGTDGLQTFLLRRSLTSYFMAGNYIFPGGRLDPSDGRTDTLACCTGTGPAPREELPLRVAAVRELFEEAGVLVAVTVSGGPVTMEDPAVQERFQRYRQLLLQGTLTLRHLADTEGLFFDTARLRLFAHWITPVTRPIRFDTRFFLCPFPEGQEARDDGVETTSGLWTAPEKALLLNREGKIVLSTPLFSMLEDLTAFTSVEAAGRSVEGREVAPVLPLFIETGGEALVVFPWDADFGRYARGDGPHTAGHGSPWSPGHNATRLIIEEERTTAYCKPP